MWTKDLAPIQELALAMGPWQVSALGLWWAQGQYLQWARKKAGWPAKGGQGGLWLLRSGNSPHSH